jgi:myo-inositol-1(or 4)-monophosphatase
MADSPVHRRGPGIVSGFAGHDNTLTSRNVVCGNEFVHGELVKILKPLG